MAKRGSSGLSLLVGVNKPSGMSSHDVVNRCRRIFGERRVGHTGTLDPLATGVLPVCVGPATRLDQFLTSHDKGYRVTVGFGFETDTDDRMGRRTQEGSVPAYVSDEGFARDRVRSLVRVHTQVPPQYSAIKVNGKKAYEIARAGESAQLAARTVEVYEAELVKVVEAPEEPGVRWVIDLSVSKGTYIRSLARDLGRELLCPAHVVELERLKAGNISLSHCVTLESLESLGVRAALDPVAALGLRFAFADDYARFVQSGTKLYADQVRLFDPISLDGGNDACSCTSSICASEEAARDGELACLVVENKLKALYRFHVADDAWKPACVFATGIARI